VNEWISISVASQITQRPSAIAYSRVMNLGMRELMRDISSGFLSVAFMITYCEDQ